MSNEFNPKSDAEILKRLKSGIDGTNVAASDINGNVLVNNEEVTVYDDTEIKERISPLEALKFRTMAGEELDYALLTVVEDSNFIPKAYTVIPFCVVVSANGIDVNKEEYSVRLKSGKTYSLQAYIRIGKVARWEYFHFYDLTHSTPIGFDGCSEHNGSAWATSSTANAIFTPTEDCDVCVMFADVDSNNTKCLLQSGTTFMKIEEIGRTYLHDPVKSVNDKDGIEDTPIGHIISFMGKTAPKHYLICDGKIYKIADYPALAEFIEKEFGAVNYFGGDGITTFAVPDMRGEFVRGYDPDGVRDIEGSIREIGKHQDATEISSMSANSGLGLVDVNTTSHDIWNSSSRKQDSKIMSSTNHTFVRLTGEKYTDTNNSVIRYSARPTNVNVLFCIKYEPTYYMEYHPIYGVENKTTLFEGDFQIEENTQISLSDSILNYDKIEIHFVIGAELFDSIRVEDIIIGADDITPSILCASNVWSTSFYGCVPYGFSNDKILYIYNPLLVGWSNDLFKIKKVVGIKCTEKTLGSSGSSEDESLTDEEINVLINNSFIKEGE